MSERSRPRQGEPVGIDSTFPAVRPTRRTWFRAHRLVEEAPDGGCWFYASLPARSGEGGRFDLPAPAGTCYLADAELVAARERLGRPGDVVAHDEVEGIVVTRVLTRMGLLANLLDIDAARRGATIELSTSAPYPLSQRWAAALLAAGFGGVQYQPRFSSERSTAVAHFGEAGVPRPLPDVASSRSMAAVLRDHGYTVLAPPSARDLGPLKD